MKKTIFNLNDKVAIVTGGSRGIGKAIANEFCNSGATVGIASRKQDGLDKAAEEISVENGKVVPIKAHTGDKDAVENLIRKTLDSCGGIDIIVNNAATNPQFGPILQSEESQWDKIWAVSYTHLTLPTNREV